MIVSNRGSMVRILAWQWKAVLLFLAFSSLACVNQHYDWITLPKLPTIPIAVVGAAIGIFVSFRTNSSYDRWWEGRKLWGRMINSSRHFATQVTSYIPNETPEDIDTRRTLVHRHIAYINTLRCLLRAQDPYQDPHVLQYTPEHDLAFLKTHSNPTHALLHMQSLELTARTDAGHLNELRLQLFDRTIAALLDIQGGCERIKKTPMPQGYGFIASRLILCFSCVFPFAIVQNIGWWTIPVTILVCISFELISEVGRILEDPFTMFYNGLPLSAICRTIERNILQCIDVPAQDLPPGLTPNEKGILM